MYKKTRSLDSNCNTMPRNSLTKEEMRVRVMKLKQELYSGQYRSWNADRHDGAQYMLNQVLNILEEYRI
jgi:hypothetical protein